MTFDWHVYLSETGAEISPSSLFMHVTQSYETLIKKGEILEANFDRICDNIQNVNDGAWWPAEVVLISGHMILLKWCLPKSASESSTLSTDINVMEKPESDTGKSKSNVFWFDIKGSHWQHLQPLGWCKLKNILWSPPPPISYLLEHCESGWQNTEWARSLSAHAANSFFFDRHCLYAYEAIRVGGYFECEHELDPLCVWPAKVVMNVGGRILLAWFGIVSQSSDNNKTLNSPIFTLFYLHRRLHPLGYGKLYDLKYCPPSGCTLDRSISNIDVFLRGACPATYKEQLRSTDIEFVRSLFSAFGRDPPLHEFKVGWKLEAVNPNLPYQVQPATVTKVFNSRYFLVELDDLQKEIKSNDAYLGEENNKAESSSGKVSPVQFVAYAGMPEIMPVNDSQLRGLYLSPPLGWPSNRSFTWTNYLTFLSALKNHSNDKPYESGTSFSPSICDPLITAESPGSCKASELNSRESFPQIHDYALQNVNSSSTSDLEHSSASYIPFCPSESIFRGTRISDSFQKTDASNHSSCNSSVSSNEHLKSQYKESENICRVEQSDSNSARFLLGMKLEMVPPKTFISKYSESDVGPALCTATVTRVEYPHLLWLLPDISSTGTQSPEQEDKPVMVDARSTDLYPVGWAELMGHPIIPPCGYESMSLSTFESSNNIKDKNNKITPEEVNCCIPGGLRPTHELQNYTINYAKDEVCPPIFINSRCYLGPFLCKSNLESLPQRFGPGSVTRVMQNLITRLVRAAYRPLRVLRMFEADWATGIATALNNLNSAERSRGSRSSVHETAAPSLRTQMNARLSFLQAQKEVIEQSRSAMRVVLVSVRCPRRGIKIEVPVEVCCRTRAIPEYCRQISLIFEACPHLLSLNPPAPLETKIPTQISVNFLNFPNLYDTSIESLKDSNFSQLSFETITSSPFHDCPSFCASRLRSRYLDRLPGWKRRMLASLRPFGFSEPSNQEIVHTQRSSFGFSGHRTRFSVAAAQRAQNGVDTEYQPLVKPRERDSIGNTVSVASNRARRKPNGRPNAHSRSSPVGSSNGPHLTYSRGRPKRSVESVTVEGTVKRVCSASSNGAPLLSTTHAVEISNHPVYIHQSPVTSINGKNLQNINQPNLSSHRHLWRPRYVPVTICSGPSITVRSIPHTAWSVSNRNRVDVIRHTIAQFPAQYLQNQDHNLNSLFSNIPRVILSSNPMFWTPVDLASYLGSTDCREMWPWLAAEAVDGQAFMLLTLPVLHRLVGLRWEDAVRLARHVISVKQAFVEQFGMNSHVNDNVFSTKTSIGQKPLLNWATCAKSGTIRRISDPDIRSLILDIRATNVTTTYIECPSCPTQTLGIRMPIFVLLFKNMNRYFTFEIEVVDYGGVKRHFRASNFNKVTTIKQFTTNMPLVLHPGWNTVVFDLQRLMEYCYRQRLLEVNRVKINANCRLRRIYFCDRPYADNELPNEYKLQLQPITPS